jgi:hypothetical protein
MNYTLNLWNVFGWCWSIPFFAIGVINTFWGGDAGYGIFIILLSLVFIPPVNTLIKHLTGLTIHPVLKVLVGLFIIWSAVGVGELFDKIEIMINDFKG